MTAKTLAVKEAEDTYPRSGVMSRHTRRGTSLHTVRQSKVGSQGHTDNH